VCICVTLRAHNTYTRALAHTDTLTDTHTHTYTQELTEARNAGHRLWKSWRLVAKFRFFYLFNFFSGQTLETLVYRPKVCVSVHTQSVHEPINISLPTGGPCIHTLYLHTAAFT